MEKKYSFTRISDEEADNLLSQGMTFEELGALDWGREYELQQELKKDEE